MKKYSQLNPKWADKTIGKTKYKIGRWGCTITSICMLWTRFYKGNLLPPDAAKQWKFTKDGLLYWSSDFDGMEFKRRYYKAPTKKTLKEWTNKSMGIIIEVNHSHWVVSYYNGWFGNYIIDPIDGKMKRMPKNYKMTGYALFLKK